MQNTWQQQKPFWSWSFYTAVEMASTISQGHLFHHEGCKTDLKQLDFLGIMSKNIKQVKKKKNKTKENVKFQENRK